MKITINTDENLSYEYDAWDCDNESLRSMIGKEAPCGGMIESIEYNKCWKVMGAIFEGKEVIK